MDFHFAIDLPDNNIYGFMVWGFWERQAGAAALKYRNKFKCTIKESW